VITPLQSYDSRAAKSSGRQNRGLPTRRVVLALWAALGAIATIVVLHNQAFVYLLYGTAVAFGFWTFLASGGSRIDPLGVWGIAFAVFAGAAGFLMPHEVFRANADGVIAVSAFLYFSQLLTVAIASPSADYQSIPRAAPKTAILPKRSLLVALTLYCIGVVLEIVSDSLFARGLMLTAPMVVVASVMRSRQRTGRIILALSLIGLYAIAFWSGFGRILLVQAVLAVVMVTQAYGAKLTTKVIFLVGISGYVVSQGNLIRSFATSTFLGTLDGLERGPQSVWVPLRTAGRIWMKMQSGDHEFTRFDTYIAAAVSWVPRGLWNDKPIGWGSELVIALAPRGTSVSYSTAGLGLGEFLWAFGLVGVSLYALVVSLGVKALQAFFYRTSIMRDEEGNLTVPFLISVVVTSNLISYFWTGSYTFTARTLTYTSPLLLIWCTSKIRITRFSGGVRPVARLD